MEKKEMVKIKTIDELNQKLETNYKNDLKGFVEQLKSKGFIILIDDAGNKHIHQFNVKVNEFIPSREYTNIVAIADAMQKSVKNYFDVPLDYDVYIHIINETLPIFTVDEVNNFYKYNKAVSNVKTERELKKELKILEDTIKDRTRKLNLTNTDVYEQLQAVINNGIVSAMVGVGLYKKIRYYQFNKTDNVFDEVTADDIHELLKKELNLNLNTRIIYKHMVKDWRTYGISSQLPVNWNNNLEYQKQIYELENNKINKLLDEYN